MTEIYLIVERPNKTEGCPAPGAQLSSRCAALCSAKPYSMYSDKHYDLCNVSLKFSFPLFFFFSHRFRAKKKNNGVFSGACALGALGVLYPTCTGTFVVFQTDISAELPHAEDMIMTKQHPGNMSAVLYNGCRKTYVR